MRQLLSMSPSYKSKRETKMKWEATYYTRVLRITKAQAVSLFIAWGTQQSSPIRT